MATATVASMLARSLPFLLPNATAPAELKISVQQTLSSVKVSECESWARVARREHGRSRRGSAMPQHSNPSQPQSAAYMGVAHIAVAHIVMAYIVMAYIVMALYSYGPI